MAGSYGQCGRKHGSCDVRNGVNREAMNQTLLTDRKNLAKELLMGQKATATFC